MAGDATGAQEGDTRYTHKLSICASSSTLVWVEASAVSYCLVGRYFRNSPAARRTGTEAFRSSPDRGDVCIMQGATAAVNGFVVIF
jgi:hypothetical protein